MKRRILITLFLGIFFCFIPVSAQKKKEAAKEPEKKETGISSSTFSGLSFRSIGPAWASGRISDFAVNPENHSEIYVAVSAGNIWKTTNNGTTWSPIFDNYGAYAIGCLKMDPNNPYVIWAGTGENNHQRQLGYGDGIYKSEDGGANWKNMGLKDSRQIGMIEIDPRNSDVVYVAAEGSIWGPGGERGLYKTTDGGKTWNKVLDISENTGINNIVMDPRNPDVLYATSEQRRRHVYTKIGGGPESAVYKSKDAGKTWDKIMKGLPSGDIGGMGIAISPVNPDVLYIIMEAAGETSGFFRSLNRGASWEKMSSHASSGQYYNEIYCDPENVDKVYSVETVSQVTLDGGKTWNAVGNNQRHVDDHALWIDPDDTKHLYIGGDGGIYETYDEGKNYIFKSNLPVTQFYRVNVDNALPFYNVYGGTQDNNSMGGPSGNTDRDGVINDDWFVTMGGDGFWVAIDPVDENIVFTEYQYGNAFLYDKKSGETVSIKPIPPEGEKTYRWYWDAPLIISPHQRERIYMAANKVFRSNDRGHSWEVISDDLTRNEDRNQFKVMGKYWSVDALTKDVSTSLWGLIVSLAESKVKKDLLYAGTDDGIIAVTEDGGKKWTRITSFPGVPEYTYVSDILPDKFNENIVYASFNNMLQDDFKPYILKSTDKGKNWTMITNKLPVNGSIHTLEQDPVNPNLLFAGSEFAFYFSVDGGNEWIEFKSGLPTSAVRDIAVQERETDLVISTFGRGIYILDDYSPLRNFSKDILDKEAHIFPVKEAKMFVETSGFSNQGSTYFKADNPPYGASITYFIKEVPKTGKAIRQEKEKALFEKGEKIPQPDYLTLQTEEKEIKPYLIFTITDENNNVVRQIFKSASKGVNRVNWNFTYSGFSPVTTTKFDPLSSGRNGIMAMPGTYKVSLAIYAKGETKELSVPVSFTCKPLDIVTFPATDNQAKLTWLKEASDYARTIYGTLNYTNELLSKANAVMQALQLTPASTSEMKKEAGRLISELESVIFRFRGPEAKASSEEIPPTDVPLYDRLNEIAITSYSLSSNISQIAKDQLIVLKSEFPPVLARVTKAGEDLQRLEKQLDAIGAPWTTGRVPKL
ncbi:MAG: YCF48-related protein [Bacteroidales bacterium]|nr:YCF48-related protein [Bacteroidales bacterium]